METEIKKKLSNLFKAAGIFLVTLWIIEYIAFSFILQDMDYTKWGPVIRFIFVVIFLFTLLSTVNTVNLKVKEINENNKVKEDIQKKE